MVTFTFDLDPSAASPQVGAFLLPDTFGATVGLQLVRTIASQLRDELAPALVRPIPQGPHFVYERNRELFLGRRGRGPLRVAWDTNLLIDYFQHGREIWECEPIDEPGAYGDELDALRVVMATWVLRDIRFYLLRHTLRDARRVLDARRLGARQQAFREFAGALRFVEAQGDRREPPPLLLPDSVLRRALEEVPVGNDRELVDEALRTGMHVFLTRDTKVVKAAPALRPLGLFVGAPGDLLEQLAASEALSCLLGGRFLTWPLPNMERAAHLYHATLAGPYRSGPVEYRELEPFI
jgi:hypothetical protein